MLDDAGVEQGGKRWAETLAEGTISARAGEAAIMTALYGFSCSNAYDEPAWFHTEEAAERFAAACHFEDMEIEVIDSEDADPKDIIDTATNPWFKRADWGQPPDYGW